MRKRRMHWVNIAACCCGVFLGKQNRQLFFFNVADADTPVHFLICIHFIIWK